MSRIVATELALPRHAVSQHEASRRVAEWLVARGKDPRLILDMLANAGVERRYSAFPVDQLFVPRGMAARNAAYAEAATELAETATRAVLDRVGLAPTDVALITSVSCTGFLIPSIDAYLANRLPLGPHVRRMPLTLLGCAGGAMGLSHSSDVLATHPEACALLVVVELPSQSFQVDDLSMAHLVSSALFGDGAAATVLAGEASPLVAEAREAGRVLPRVVATRTHFFHDTLDAMGFEVRDSGFHMILAAKIPYLLDETIWPEIEAFLVDHGLSVGDVDHFLIHPGGRRILDVVEQRIGRGPDVLAHSRAVLRDYGNLSSASVIALLHEHARADVAEEGDRGLLVAFGPGFNAEMILLEWAPCSG